MKVKPRRRVVRLLLPRGIAVYERIRAAIERRAMERGDIQIYALAPRWPDWRDLDEGPHEAAIVGPAPVPFLGIRSRKPALTVAAHSSVEGLPSVISDSGAIGRLAARHLRESGAGFLASAEWVRRPFATERLAAFEREAHRLGVPCRVVWLSPETRAESRNPLRWQKALERLLRPFLKSLPRGAGIFTTADDRAINLWPAIESCHLRVPEDLLLLGVDDVESSGMLPLQGLSSIAQDCAAIGRRALDRVAAALQEKVPLAGRDLIPPLGVVARRSTEAIPHPDPLVADALRRIRSGEHPEDTAETLAGALGVSRVTLWRRFEKGTGQSPAEYIRKARLDHARRLLRETRLTVGEIARRCGYYHASAFSRAFRRAEHAPPEKWRRSRS